MWQLPAILGAMSAALAWGGKLQRLVIAEADRAGWRPKGLVLLVGCQEPAHSTLFTLLGVVGHQMLPVENSGSFGILNTGIALTSSMRWCGKAL